MGILVKAPGKVILFGEHAVVYGKSAVAASLGLYTFALIDDTEKSTIKLDLPDVGLKREWATSELKGASDAVWKSNAYRCDRRLTYDTAGTKGTFAAEPMTETAQKAIYNLVDCLKGDSAKQAALSIFYIYLRLLPE
ncbi:Mevalonate kinase [Irineochytrium annulatum]|nr:Mevalonate kinase [Irineochytrium annulatum]